MYQLYEFTPSGNAYKIRLLLTQLDIPFKRIELDITKGETDTPHFLKINPNARIPVLEISPGCYLPESNAIMWYLAQGTQFLPTDKLQQAQVLQWLFFEQYTHEPNIATPRFWISILKQADKYQVALKQKMILGYEALAVMEKHLSDKLFFVGNQYSIADIGLYAYTHVAHEGCFDLSPFSAIQAWLKRVESQPRYIRITD